MDVKKIFTMLIGIVACVVLGAFLLNTFMPNVTAAVVNAMEDMVYNVTGLSMNFNGDGKSGGQSVSGTTTYDATNQQAAEDVAGNVAGFGGTAQTP